MPPISVQWPRTAAKPMIAPPKKTGLAMRQSGRGLFPHAGSLWNRISPGSRLSSAIFCKAPRSENGMVARCAGRSPGPWAIISASRLSRAQDKSPPSRQRVEYDERMTTTFISAAVVKRALRMTSNVIGSTQPMLPPHCASYHQVLVAIDRGRHLRRDDGGRVELFDDCRPLDDVPRPEPRAVVYACPDHATGAPKEGGSLADLSGPWILRASRHG